jgi:hypothetical protein
MHRYASSTPEARELASELEFVWDQIRSNVPSTHSSPASPSLRAQQPQQQHLGLLPPTPYNDDPLFTSAGEETSLETLHNPRERAWRGRVEKALAKMATEVAALREQLENRRFERRRYRARMWCLWCAWTMLRHLLIEAVFWGLVFLWMRRRGDRRAEEALRLVMRFVREGLRLGGRRGAS